VRVERRTGDGDLSVRVLRWPSLSPDAKRLVFGALGHIYGQELPGGRPTRLTSGTDCVYTPAYSPDGLHRNFWKSDEERRRFASRSPPVLR
jgi:hypothetical protein